MFPPLLLFVNPRLEFGFYTFFVVLVVLYGVYRTIFYIRYEDVSRSNDEVLRKYKHIDASQPRTMRGEYGGLEMDPTRLPAVISLLPSGAGSSSMRGVRRIS
jgi:hypothetical protein